MKILKRSVWFFKYYRSKEIPVRYVKFQFYWRNVLPYILYIKDPNDASEKYTFSSAIMTLFLELRFWKEDSSNTFWRSFMVLPIHISRHKKIHGMTYICTKSLKFRSLIIGEYFTIENIFGKRWNLNIYDSITKFKTFYFTKSNKKILNWNKI